MTLLLRHEDVCAAVGMADAIVAMEEAFREEGEGAVLLPPRINMKAGKGWLRVGPVSLEKSGWMGFKAMNLAPGHGVRYQVQRGDTLFGIARSRYGDGKRWQEIASANPGLTPATLQAGSTIVVP